MLKAMAFFISLLFIAQVVSPFLYVHAQDPPGYISLSCGAPEGTRLKDSVTNMTYNSDEAFIESGSRNEILAKHQVTVDRQYWYIRYFPKGDRSCYTLNLTEGDKYLIRATFYHGGYDEQPSTSFELQLGTNLWTRVSTTNETDLKVYELIHRLTNERLQVCLVKDGESTPFISTLELRKLNSTAYENGKGSSLQTLFLGDVGSATNQLVRHKVGVYGSDIYDRIWKPFNSADWSTIRTNESVGVNNEYNPPEDVMVTASIPKNPNATMMIPLNVLDKTSRLFVVLHFSEIHHLSAQDLREFQIFYNGRLLERSDGPLIPKKLWISTTYITEELGPNANGQYTISLQRTERSTLPPILNAMEVYLVKTFPQQETDRTQVEAMLKIKWEYGLNDSNWEGDPCAPNRYKWDGLNCTQKGPINEGPHFITTLDLSRDNLSGEIPEFLANLKTLKLINLSNNNLSGTVPKSLMDKVRNESILLRMEGNPMLCSSTSCANRGSSNKKTEIIVGVPIVLIILTGTVVLFIIWRRKVMSDSRTANLGVDVRISQSLETNLDENPNQHSFPSDKRFVYEEVTEATDGFSNTNILGEGGFGFVYRGVLRDGTEIAVKQLKDGSGQGEQEFQTEIQIISRVHHRHLISLLGYCILESKRLLVYEFVPNGTLDTHLHDKRSPLEWENRFKIALGVGKGLCYLHDNCHPKIIHRDIKSSNILLERNFEPKIADFGLAKPCSDAETHVSTSIMGTIGYLAPEYVYTGKLTNKSDIFSFGIVLLELITGHRPLDLDDGLLHWVKPLIKPALSEDQFDGFVDPRLENNFDVNEMKIMIACAAACVRQSAKRRPTMSQIVLVFEGNMSIDEITEGDSNYNTQGSSVYSFTNLQHIWHLKAYAAALRRSNSKTLFNALFT